MISRRNIRVKVMQTLYTIEAQKEIPKPGEAVRFYKSILIRPRQLFVYLVYFLTELARYAETDSRLRLSKHLPTDQDRNVNIKLAGNEFLWKILEHDFLSKKHLKQISLNCFQTTELIKKTYQELTEIGRIQKIYFTGKPG